MFIAEAAREGQYLYAPVRGAHDLDQTAFHPPDRELDLVARERRPAILHQWHAVGDTPAFKHPGFMMVVNAIVLDHADHPVRNWPELPKAISGQCEGLRMEYWKRVNRHITVNDIRARMPSMTSGRTDLKLRELVTSSFGNRMDRARAKGACIAWNRREGTMVKETQMLKLMSPDVRLRVLETNSTAHWRDLKNQEVKRILEANKGKATSMKRASWRALSPTTRAQREAKALALKARKGNAKDSATSDDAETVLSSESDDESTLGRQSNAGRDHTKVPQNTSALDENVNPSHLLSSREKRPLSQVTDRRTQESIQASDSLPEHSFEPTLGVDCENNLETVEIENSNQRTMAKLPHPRFIRRKLGIDYRLRAPIYLEEMLCLDEALRITRKNLKELLPGHDVPKTDSSQCYMFQYEELQIYLERKWHNPNLPKLAIIEPFYNKIEDWKEYQPGAETPVVSSMDNTSSQAKRPSPGDDEDEHVDKKQKVEESKEGDDFDMFAPMTEEEAALRGGLAKGKTM
ncbi:MAG: hypothetical protein Q9214_002080 [Letrouitia sp. 1 TL-2023]